MCSPSWYLSGVWFNCSKWSHGFQNSTCLTVKKYHWAFISFTKKNSMMFYKVRISVTTGVLGMVSCYVPRHREVMLRMGEAVFWRSPLGLELRCAWWELKNQSIFPALPELCWLGTSIDVTLPSVSPHSHNIQDEDNNNHKQPTFGDMHCILGTLSSWEFLI